MTDSFSRRITSRMPSRLRTELKRLYYARQIAGGTFVSPEPEFNLLADYVREGSWVIDVGANVGHYTKRLSELVGASGRVIAFEPVPETFSLLAANMSLFKHSNVTLINAAVSDNAGIVGMVIPGVNAGDANFYQAHITSMGNRSVAALAVRIDSLDIPNRITFVKIDAEGHEGHALLGMKTLLLRDRPTLVIEAGAREATNLLAQLGYTSKSLPHSPNLVFVAP